MRKNLKNYSLILLVIIVISNMSIFASETGKITGKVTNKKKEPLPGASVVIKNLNMGTAATIDGNYILSEVPIGEHILKVNYIGYKPVNIKISVKNNEVTHKTIQLERRSISGETVEVSAQAKGQNRAINRQVSSDITKNVVSAEKIQELPEANAAEAVGRLPGVALKREGGEGNKVVIRGLSPKYSKIQIEGVNMASTNSKNRSTDLSMISPYILKSIDVTKVNMADDEANQTGGKVNFRLREAKKDPSLKIISQGGYNSLRRKFGDYKFVGMGGKRFFDDRFGIYGNIDVERRNRSSNSVSAGYKWVKTQSDSMAVPKDLTISDVSRDIKRYGGSLTLDYNTPTTKLKFGNIYSKINETIVSRDRSIQNAFTAGHLTNFLNYNENELQIMINSFKAEHYIKDLKISANISHSYSNNKTLEELDFGGVWKDAINTSVPYSVHPDKLFSYLPDDLSEMKIGDIKDSNSDMEEREWAASLDLNRKINFSKNLKLNLTIGGKYKYKKKSYDYNRIHYPFIYGKEKGKNLLLRNYPWMQKMAFSGSSQFPYKPFIDKNYNPGNFMAGNYELERVPNSELAKEAIYLLQDSLGINMSGAQTPMKFVPDFHKSKKDDYNGEEFYKAAYILPKFSFGSEGVFTLIPGIRYEHNRTIYTGIRGDGKKQGYDIGFNYDKKIHTRNNEFFLPMIHAKYKPAKWFDIRASYTKSLSRPSYMNFIPSWYFKPRSAEIDYRNYKLKPEKSENIDLTLSFYGDKIGLLTFGGFHKNITDMVFQKTIYFLDKETVLEYGLTKEATEYDPENLVGMGMNAYINNPKEAVVQGFETEYQSNFWFLPGLLQNIVLNLNYTHIYSNAKYPKVIPNYSKGPFGGKELEGKNDTSYTAPLLDQPDDLLNITLGYDYKGFSIRGSMQYKSEVFVRNNYYQPLRGYSDNLTLYDLSLRQELPIEGLEIFGTVSNLGKALETGHINQSTNFYTSKSYYGMTIDLGVKYEF